MAEDKRFDKILEEAKLLHDSKNNDYAKSEDPLSNLRASERFGIPAWIGTLVRMTDKMSRLEQLSTGKEPQVKGESIRDSLMDLGIYAFLAVELWDEKEK